MWDRPERRPARRLAGGASAASLGAAAIAAVAALALGGGCAGTGPTFDPIDDQVVAVGQELVIPISATTEHAGEVIYDVHAGAPGASKATLTQRPDGSALFTWTPAAADVGTWVFDFSATDAGGKSTESVQVEVRSAIGQGTLPLFHRPLGAGTAVQMKPGACVEIQAEVSDQDSTKVTFAEEEPTIDGGQLSQDKDFQATWRWCPTPDQLKAQDRYLLTLSADDGASPKAIKRYQIILRDPSVRNQLCPGTSPHLTHTAADQSTVNPLDITAEVADDLGLKAAPLVYYSTKQPSDPPDLTQMTELSMALDSGDSRSGTWKASLPNPVADGAPGAEATIYYVLVVEDNDDSGGKCDHVVQQVYQMNVTAPGGDGGLGMCEPCTADVQCGGPDDRCMGVGVEGQSFCFQACGAGGECPSGTVCSPDELTSVDGAVVHQCVPEDETCGAAGGCADDVYEQNDGKSQAQAIEKGTTDALHMCPAGDIQDDEDWYSLTVTGDTQTTARIVGETYPNMDLSLLDESGKLVAASEDWGSNDGVDRCLPAGTYYLRVYSYFPGENDYSIQLDEAPGDCRDQGNQTCEDDPFEDDDGAGQARTPDFESQVFRASDQQICAGDDDWFYVYLFEGESVWGTLSFDQQDSDQDLDFRVYDGAGELLTACTEDDPSGCDAYNGQSADSNEEMQFTAPAADDYYVVVHGWAGSENSYDVCLALEEGLCTLP